MTGIDRAIEAAGGATALAKLLTVSHQVVYHWQKRGWVPSERALQIKALFNIPVLKLLNPKLAKLIS
jgi:DNA-binding transcriptional regulator YdaS (Cro superfamily)